VPNQEPAAHKPYIAPESDMPEFTVRSVVVGALFGILFGAATVYLALKAGLTISASIPIAVLAISLGRKFLKTTILENNIIQTTGSAGESIAAGVVFTLPGFLFLTLGPDGQSVGAPYFNYWTIFTLAVFGGVLGVLMMVPLRRALIVKEHGTLPYPEGTACASVLIAGDKGGDFARTAYQGVFFALIYAALQKLFHVITDVPAFVTRQTNKYFPSATINGEITPEYLGVGYIIGPRIAGVLVAGGVLAWLGLIPLLATLVPMAAIAEQLVKLGELKSIMTPGGPGGWDPITQTFSNTAVAIYRAYVRQIGAGAVAAGGFITLLKTMPTILASFKSSLATLKDRTGAAEVLRTERDLSILTVLLGSVALILLLALLPVLPGGSFGHKLLVGILIVVFGFFFVTVASRIVGLIGSSSNPISGMTIATLMGTCLIFIGVGWTGSFYEPLALVVGSMVCIAAANAGATSQDLKTGFLVGATPRAQQISLFVGALASALVIGATVQILDKPTADMVAQGVTHAIGSDKFPAPQGTLMATLIRGLLSFNLDWQFVLVGAFLAVTIELCGVNALSFAVGAYLPLSTTLPIFVGGAIKGLVDWRSRSTGQEVDESELGSGSLFATGLVAGGALAGVAVALLSVNETVFRTLESWSARPVLVGMLGEGGYQLLGLCFFLLMGAVLFAVARKPQQASVD
jgi:OPT family oligopeptide transporter